MNDDTGEGESESNCAALVFGCLNVTGDIKFIVPLLFGLLFAVALIEYAMEHAEKWTKRDEIFEVVREKVVSELAILGLISFVLFTVSSSNAFRENEAKEIFEFVHMTLFMTAVLYVSVVLITTWSTTRKLTRRWKKWEVTPLKEVIRDHEELLAESWWTSILCRQMKFNRQFNISGRFYFHALRGSFLQRYDEVDMPAVVRDPKNLFFTKYLRKCTRETFANVASLGIGVWISYIMIVLLGGILEVVYFGSVNGEDDGDSDNIADQNADLYIVMFSLGYIFMFVNIYFVWNAKKSCYRIMKIFHGGTDAADLIYNTTTSENALEISLLPNQDGDTQIDDLMSNIADQHDTERESSVWQYLNSCRNVHPMVKQFPFRAPNFVVRLFQATIMVYAVQLTFYFLLFIGMSNDLVGSWQTWLYFLPTIYFATFYAPSNFRYYSLCRYVGPLVNHDVLQNVVDEIQSDCKETGEYSPTLALEQLKERRSYDKHSFDRRSFDRDGIIEEL